MITRRIVGYPAFASLLFTFSIGFSQALDLNSIFNFPQSAFDSNDCCWRELNANGQYEQAAKLIVRYLHVSKQVVNPHALKWHAGQCFAMAGKNKLARYYMQKTYSPLNRWVGGADGRTWYYYARGTIAFLDRNRKKLEFLVAKWERRYEADVNYKALQELAEHWDWGYEKF